MPAMNRSILDRRAGLFGCAAKKLVRRGIKHAAELSYMQRGNGALADPGRQS
jgi:hypothetical protein